MFNFYVSTNLFGDTVAFLAGADNGQVYGVVFNSVTGMARGEAH